MIIYLLRVCVCVCVSYPVYLNKMKKSKKLKKHYKILKITKKIIKTQNKIKNFIRSIGH